MPICLAVLQFFGAPVSQVRLIVHLRRARGVFDPGPKRPLSWRKNPVFIHIDKRIFEAFERFMYRATEAIHLLVGVVPTIKNSWATTMRDSVKARAPLSYALFASRRLRSLLGPSISTFAHSKFLNAQTRKTNTEQNVLQRSCLVACACYVVEQKKIHANKELWSIICISVGK